MDEGSESSAVLTAEQELLIEGCKSYLDVMHAANAFQVRVCNAARDVLSKACARISKVTKLVKPLEATASIYVEPAVADINFDGSEAWVGAWKYLDEPVWATLYLAFVFFRDPNGGQQTADVCFALEANARWGLTQLSNIFGQHQDCIIHNDRGWLAVELRRPLQLGNPLNVREELETMLDNALTQWDNYSNNATANGESA